LSVLRSKSILVCLGLILMVSPVRAAVLHVRSDAAGPETNGLSWASSFNTITQALQYAANGDEVWVTASTYKGAVIATSPLVDAGNDSVLAWIERDVLGNGIDIGALEFGPDGIPAFTLSRTAQSEYPFELRGYPGQGYAIEGSTNLLEWVSICTNVAEMGGVLLRDALGTNYLHRFLSRKTGKVAKHPN
jgi:hypothetical protein